MSFTEPITKKATKAYISALKELAKNSPLKDKVMIKDPSAFAGNGTTYAEAWLDIEGDGEFLAKALDSHVIDPTLDKEVYRTGEYQNLTPFDPHPCEWAGSSKLSQEDIEAILYASKFVSSDDTRAALQQVVIMDNRILATDGYRAYTTTRNWKIKGEIHISPLVISMLKKTYKEAKDILGWQIQWGTAQNGSPVYMLFSSRFTIREIQNEQPFPDLMKILTLTEPYDTTVQLPVANLCKLADKNHGNARVEDNDGISLIGNFGTDAFATPLKATVSHITPMLPAHDFDTREVIMPMKAEGEKFCMNLALLKDITEKDGTITLLWAKGKMLPLLVVR